MWVTTKPAKINHTALDAASANLEKLKEFAKNDKLPTTYDKVDGYSRGEIKNIVRSIRQDLQRFSNNLEYESEWIDSE